MVDVSVIPRSNKKSLREGFGKDLILIPFFPCSLFLGQQRLSQLFKFSALMQYRYIQLCLSMCSVYINSNCEAL